MIRPTLPLLVAAAVGALALTGPSMAWASPEPTPHGVPTGAPPSGSLKPRAASDLTLREAGVAPAGAEPAGAGSAPGRIYALKNSGSDACRVSGGVGIRLYDASGAAFPLRFAPRTLMAMLLTLQPGAEASFTVSFASPPKAPCASSARIEAFLAADATPIAAETSLPVCDGLVTISNLRPGAPPPRASAARVP
jgi:hypothetical protein